MKSACLCWRSCLCVSNIDFQDSRASGDFNRRHSRSRRRTVCFDLPHSLSYYLVTRSTWHSLGFVVEYSSELIKSSMKSVRFTFFHDRFVTNCDLAWMTVVWNEKETIEWSEIDGGVTVILLILMSSRMTMTSIVWPRLCVGPWTVCFSPCYVSRYCRLIVSGSVKSSKWMFRSPSIYTGQENRFNEFIAFSLTYAVCWTRGFISLVHGARFLAFFHFTPTHCRKWTKFGLFPAYV